MKKFSLFDQLELNLKTIEDIDSSVKITLGPTGKNGILANEKSELKFLTSGSILLKSLEFPDSSSNVILKLLEQAAVKTFQISGDGSTTTTLLSCDLLKNALKFLVNGYNSIFLSNGLKKLAYFLIEKVVEFSMPIENTKQLLSVLKTAVGKKINNELYIAVEKCLPQIKRDGLILIEENISTENEIQVVEGLEIDRGYASSYFVTDLKTFEVIYDNPYILITSQPIVSFAQIREIIEYVKRNNKPLVLIVEEINKDILSSLILNNIQKKLKIVVIKYTAIKFLKTGILEDLATLTYANYFVPSSKQETTDLSINDLGTVEKVIINKEKSTFLLSKFSKVIAQRRINELNRELLTTDSEAEKNICKTRIARLSGNITKIKIGLSNKYEIIEQRQKVEKAINTIRSALEEGVLPGGGSFYLYLREEILYWSYINLIGDEFFASTVIINSLIRPFQELFSNINLSGFSILETLMKKGYPFAYDVLTKNFVNTFEEGLIDSAKSVRSILWNSITIVAIIITSD
jgi:chaperonin GroEL